MWKTFSTEAHLVPLVCIEFSWQVRPSGSSGHLRTMERFGTTRSNKCRDRESSESGLSGLHIVHDKIALASGNILNIFVAEVDTALNSGSCTLC